MLLIRFIFISLVIHTLMFLSISIYKDRRVSSKRPQIPFKLKTQKLRKKKSSSLGNESPFSWKSFSVGKSTGKTSSSTGSGGVKVLRLLDDLLVYPSEFAKIGIDGYVTCRVVINKNAQFDEKLSYIYSNSKYLEIYVRQTLRKALLNSSEVTSRDVGVYKISIQFKLHTGLNKQEEHKIDNYTIFRSRYGVKSKIDRLNNGVAQTIGSIMNPLSLLRFLPNIKNAQAKRLSKKLNRYHRDEYW